MQNVKKTYKLFLDDVRTPRGAYSYTRFEPFLDNDWVIVRSFNQFANYIEYNWEEYEAFPSLVAFDHDLADEHYGAPVTAIFTEKTGMDCVRWLVDYCMDNDLELPEWYCHTCNTVGKINMDSLLSNFKKHQENENRDTKK